MDGERLVELDIANCQPLLLGLTASSRHNPQQTPNNQTNPYSICRAFLTDQKVANYIELCERGQLYEHLWGGTRPRRADVDHVTRFCLAAATAGVGGGRP